VYLISTPMWNFSIPYALKYYIDAIVQPGYMFKYNEQGQPIPLVLGKTMVCVTSRGGDYSENSPLRQFDFVEPYLRTVFGFVGIYDMHFINAQPMDMSRAVREAAIERAINEARTLAAEHNWPYPEDVPAMERPVGLKPQPIV
jgi:FMN-dependent NADH-azoreductase